MQNKKKAVSPAIEQIRSDLKKKSIDYTTAVNRLLVECNISDIPNAIPVVSIAEELGFKVYNVTFKDNNVAGIMCDTFSPVKPFDEQRVIALNRNDYATRKQFTIAHELGHFMLHCGEKNEFFERYKKGLDHGQRSEQENEANRFAAELLMPAQSVYQVLKDLPSTSISDRVCALVNTFIVSEKAALRRLKELNILPEE